MWHANRQSRRLRQHRPRQLPTRRHADCGCASSMGVVAPQSALRVRAIFRHGNRFPRRPSGACMRTSRATAWTRLARAGPTVARHRPATLPGCSGAAMPASAGRHGSTSVWKRRRARRPRQENEQARPRRPPPMPVPRTSAPRRRPRERRRSQRRQPERRQRGNRRQHGPRPRKRAPLAQRRASRRPRPVPARRPARRQSRRQSRRLRPGNLLQRRQHRRRRRQTRRSPAELQPGRALPRAVQRRKAQARRLRHGKGPTPRVARAQVRCPRRRRRRPDNAPRQQAAPIPIWWTTWQWQVKAALPSGRVDRVLRKKLVNLSRNRLSEWPNPLGSRATPRERRVARGQTIVPGAAACCFGGIGPNNTSPRPTPFPTSCASRRVACIERRAFPASSASCGRPWEGGRRTLCGRGSSMP